MNIQEWIEAVLGSYISDTQQRKQLPTASYQAFKAVSDYLSDFPAIRDNSNLLIKWSVGSGNWAKVPWLAVLNRRWTESVQHGVYVVYLFREDMSGVYLTLNQGVTKILDKYWKSEGYEILRANAEIIRRECFDLLDIGFRFDDQIHLTDSGLGQAYENSNIAYKFYPSDDLPSEDELEKDLEEVIRAYSKIPTDILDSSRDNQIGMAATQLLALLRKRKEYTSWESVEDETFQEEEINYKRAACAEASELLGAVAFGSLIAAESWDEILARLKKIGQKTNLLWLAAPSTGDLAIIENSEALDKPSFCRALYSLLHGSGSIESRLSEYLKYVEENELDNKWTFPTYFMFLLHPSSEMFIKPSVAQWLAEVLDLEVKYSSRPSVEFYTVIREYCSKLLEVFAEYGARDMLDVQSIIWTAYSSATINEKKALTELQQKYFLFDGNWAAECDIGYEYFWFPGQQVPLSGREALLGLTKCDVFITFFSQNIKYAAEVQDYAKRAEAPADISELVGEIGWNGSGYQVPLSGRILPNPINYEKLPGSVRDFIRSMNEDGALVREIPSSLVREMQEAHMDAGWPEGTLASSPRALLAEWIGNLRHNARAEVGRFHYKEVLLIALLDLLDKNSEHENLFTWDEIYEYMLEVCRRENDVKDKKSLKYPFVKLSNDVVPLRVWELAGEDEASIADVVWPVFNTPSGREYLRGLIAGEKEDAEVDTVTMDEPIELAPAVENLIENVRATGFIYQPWQLAAFVTAVRTKPFVILAGVTGTGKSKLPVIVSDLTGGYSRLVSVKPDWTDSTDVLGYTDLRNEFRAGELLRFARAAATNPNMFHTCVIDEMNIARVEHYFAEVLSRMEERESDTAHGGYMSGTLFDASDEQLDENWRNVRIPSNMAIVGTVNMDESTHGFSKKVLDRAFTIELSDIDLSKWQNDVNQVAGEFWPASTWYPRAVRLGELDASDSDTEIIVSVIEVLESLNGILKHGQLQVGYRSRDEIVLFVLNAAELQEYFVTDSGVAVDPLDLAIHMKILPRIIGGGHAVKRVVRELLLWAWDGTRSDKEPEALIEVWDKAGRPESIEDARYGRTAARLCLMYERFAEGFTSYWL